MTKTFTRAQANDRAQELGFVPDPTGTYRHADGRWGRLIGVPADYTDPSGPSSQFFLAQPGQGLDGSDSIPVLPA